MARQRAAAKYLGFPKGLNTETSLLAPVEGTTADELNMDLRLNKLIRARRLGLENVGDDQSTAGTIIGGYYWESADSFVLVGLQETEAPATKDLVTLYLYNGDLEYIEEWTVEILKGSRAYPSFSDIRNRLVMTFGAKPFVFARRDNGNFDAWTLDLYFRDFKLIDDGLGISERPVVLTDEHRYNVYNAGWYQNVQVSGGQEYIAVDALYAEINEYPSNSDIVSLGLTADRDGITIFNGQSLETPLTGNSEAARGHFVFNIREIDRQDRAWDQDKDGVPSKTLVQVLANSFNVSGLGGNLLYSDSQPTGNSSDPSPPPSGSGGSGGGSSIGSDPVVYPPGFWEVP